MNYYTSIKPETVEKKAATQNSILRLLLVAVAIYVQCYFLYEVLARVEREYTWMEPVTRALALLICIGIYSQNRTSTVKIPWIILLLVFPIAGTMIYLIVGLNGSTRRMRTRFDRIDQQLFPLIPKRDEVIETIERKDQSVANMMRYIQDHALFPAYDDSSIEFYPDASEALEAQIAALRKAKHFIFMEYHAIENSTAFAGIKKILAEKAAEGLDVRVFYDDVGSIAFVNHKFVREMNNLGIQCRVFNPVIPLINLFLNNRDHRKITVIDGEIGFTGGYNLANEYFNLTHPYGHWKDTGVKITGSAVRNLTMMFLEMWNAIRATDKDDTEFERFFPELPENPNPEGAVVQPYGDTPLDTEHVGENVYLNAIFSAEKYVWFITPYLIITDEMNKALGLAAERGVDVRIITPGIPDKRVIYRITRSYYQRLVTDGVQIYEYTPGFCHAKQCVVDGRVAMCGTINLDYRSFLHHFEDGVLMYHCKAVDDVRADFEATFPMCENVTEKYRRPRNLLWRGWNNVLRLFSTLL